MAKRKSRKKSASNTLILLVGFAIVLFVLASAKSIFKSSTSTSGKSLGAFLAKDDEGGGGGDHGGSSGSGSSDSSGPSGSSGSSGSGGSTSKIIFVNPTTGVKTKIETEQNKDETKTEIKTGDDRVKTETKNGETKVEVRSGGVKVKFELKDGNLVIKRETENENKLENEQELNKNETQQVENELEKDDIKVSSAGGSIVVLHRGIGAKTILPISIDTTTNSLIVTTPAGTKIVTILPDVAINNLIARNVISEVEGKPSQAAELNEVENKPVFEVKGVKNERFLGVLPVSLRKKVIMNAQTAQVEQEQESFFTRLLDLVSF